MKSLFVKLLNSSFVRYGIVGAFGLFVDMGFFYLFYEVLGINYIVSNISSSSLAVIHNFLWNSFFTFKVKDMLWMRFVSFYLVALVGMALSSGMLAVMIDMIHMNAMVAKLISVLVVAIIQYFVNKKLTFRKKKLVTINDESELN